MLRFPTQSWATFPDLWKSRLSNQTSPAVASVTVTRNTTEVTFTGTVYAPEIVTHADELVVLDAITTGVAIAPARYSITEIEAAHPVPVTPEVFNAADNCIASPAATLTTV